MKAVPYAAWWATNLSLVAGIVAPLPIVLDLSLPLPTAGLIASSWLSISSVISASSTNKVAASSALSQFVDLLQTVQPTQTLGDVDQVFSAALALATPVPTANILSILENALEVALTAVGQGNDEFFDLIAQQNDAEINGANNVNPDPPYTIYPQRADRDAPYSFSEDNLRRHIYIPSSFTYGKKQPVLLSPGTGAQGGNDFIATLIPLLQNSSFGDPVWINTDNNTLDDAQTTAEVDAYAINYIAAVSGRNVSIITESQGSIDTQWALKYWPSTRENVTDFIPVSGDLKGTLGFDDPIAELLGTPAVYQQRFVGSNYLSTLRAEDGSSAYVPTTSIYTATDEIVEPQQGVGASAYVDDVRGVGVTNNEIQTICPLLPAGGAYGHVDILVNPLVWALVQDALTHDGPGEPSRLDLDVVCNEFLAPGLTGANFLAAAALLPQFVVNILSYAPKVDAEPPIMAYAIQ